MWEIPLPILLGSALLFLPVVLVGLVGLVGGLRSRPSTPDGMTPTERLMLRPELLTPEPAREQSGSTITRHVQPRDALALANTVDDVVAERNGWTSEVQARSILQLCGPGDLDRAVFVVEELAPDDRGPPVIVGVVVIAVDREIAVNGKPAASIQGWIGPDHRGRGHMTNAIMLTLTNMARFGVVVATSITEVSNVAARRVLEQNGFAVRGTMRHLLPNGK